MSNTCACDYCGAEYDPKTVVVYTPEAPPFPADHDNGAIVQELLTRVSRKRADRIARDYNRERPDGLSMHAFVLDDNDLALLAFRARKNVREACVVIGEADRVIAWHLPPDRTTAALPDSRTLWDVYWENRFVMIGSAHTHPWLGLPSPSWEDITSYAACESGLGQRYVWWIASLDQLVVVRWVGPGRHDYSVTKAEDEPPWVAELRRLSIVSPDPAPSPEGTEPVFLDVDSGKRDISSEASHEASCQPAWKAQLARAQQEVRPLESAASVDPELVFERKKESS